MCIPPSTSWLRCLIGKGMMGIMWKLRICSLWAYKCVIIIINWFLCIPRQSDPHFLLGSCQVANCCVGFTRGNTMVSYVQVGVHFMIWIVFILCVLPLHIHRPFCHLNNVWVYHQSKLNSIEIIVFLIINWN